MSKKKEVWTSLYRESKWNRVDTWLIYLPRTGPIVPICSNGSVGADQAARRKSLVATDDLGISQKKGSQHRGGAPHRRPDPPKL